MQTKEEIAGDDRLRTNLGINLIMFKKRKDLKESRFDLPDTEDERDKGEGEHSVDSSKHARRPPRDRNLVIQVCHLADSRFPNGIVLPPAIPDYATLHRDL